MRTIISTCLFIFLFPFLSCSNGSPSQPEQQGDASLLSPDANIDGKVSLSAEFVKSGYYMLAWTDVDTPGTWSEGDSTMVFHLRCSVKNTSTDTLSFISMSCSHEDMFVTQDSSQMKVQPYYICFSNYPVVVWLEPDSVYTKEIMIRPIGYMLDHGTEAKIGFRFVEVDVRGDDFSDVIDKYEKRQEKGITIWSDYVSIEP